MNEFTKEELEIIENCLENDFYTSNWPKSMYEPLITKIQTMIENWCDHEFHMIGIPERGGHLECCKCGQKMFCDFSKGKGAASQ